MCVCAKASCFQHARKLLHYTASYTKRNSLRHRYSLVRQFGSSLSSSFCTAGCGSWSGVLSFADDGGGREASRGPAAGIVNQVVCFKLFSGNSITSCSLLGLIGRVAHTFRFVHDTTYFQVLSAYLPPHPNRPRALFSSSSSCASWVFH